MGLGLVYALMTTAAGVDSRESARPRTLARLTCGASAGVVFGMLFTLSAGLFGFAVLGLISAALGGWWDRRQLARGHR